MKQRFNTFKNNQKALLKEQGKFNYTMRQMRWILPLALAAFVVMSGVDGAFAQEPNALNIDTENMTTQLFQGANIIIAALGTVMFLLAGFKLGGVLIRGIVDTIGGIKF